MNRSQTLICDALGVDEFNKTRLPKLARKPKLSRYSNQESFNPDGFKSLIASMHWSRSGEILIMTILGGMGSLYGGVLGAALYVCLEYFLSQATEHWQVIFGPIIVIFVLFAGRGLMGLFAPRRAVS